MKKALIVIIFSLVAVFTFVTLFYYDRDAYYYQMETVGENDFAQLICFSSLAAAPEMLYQEITSVLDKYNANLYVTRIHETEGKSVLTKYVYINQLSMFDLKLVNGRFYSDSEKESPYFLSTNPAQENGKIGLIDSFPTNTVFEIRTLKSGLDATLFNQVFTLQTTKSSDVAKIIEGWTARGILVSKMNQDSASRVDIVMVYAVVAACLIIFSLVMFHDILRSNKSIAIEKVNGFSVYAIWKEKAWLILVLLGVCSMCVLLIGSLVIFKNWTPLAEEFLGKVALILGVMLGLAVLFLSLPFLYIRWIRITEVLRNKQDTWLMIIFNSAVKLVATTVLIIYCSTIMSQIQVLQTQYTKNFSHWNHAEDYYGVSVTDANQVWDVSDDSSERLAEEELGKNKAIYQYYNRYNAIYADFDMFASYSPPMQYEYQYRAVVNPNYLNKHIVYDTKGKEVHVVENSREIVLLVPEKFRNSEQKILDCYRPENGAVPSIIWIKNDQSLFSYRFDIKQDNGNCVDNAIIQVLTEANGDEGYYEAVIGIQGSPFKIYSEDSSLSKVQKEIESYYSQYYDVEAYHFFVTDAYEVVTHQMFDLQKRIFLFSLLVVIIFVIILLVLLQNITGFISENRFRIALQQTLGFHIFSKFSRYYLINLISWIGVLGVSLVFRFSALTALLCGIFIVSEVVLSLCIFIIIERRNVLRIMKGG